MTENAHSHKGSSRGLLIGREVAAPDVTRFGFGPAAIPQVKTASSDVVYSGDGHLMTIAPTGAGKGVSCVVPALLRHDGPVIALDVKAENYAMTRRHRRALGSKVMCIDPFGAAARVVNDSEEDASDEIAGFNPLDLLPYLSDDRDTACRSLADMMVSPDGHSNDPFWREAAVGALAALIDAYERMEGPSRSISAIVNDLSVETPTAEHPGDLPAETLGLSFFEHDPLLMDSLDAVDLEPAMVWRAFVDAGGSGLGRGRMVNIRALIENAAQLGMDRGSVETDLQGQEDRDLAAKEIADDLIGSKARFADFKLQLETLSPGIADTGAADTLWQILKAATLISHAGPQIGSFAETAADSKAPENYPLALHRAANCPSNLCRSLCAQPYTADKTWGSILCVLRAELSQFSGRSIAHCLGESFDLDAIRDGDDISLYIAFPPARIRSHPLLFRVMIEGMMNVILARDFQPERKTLFLLDEIAQLGRLDLLVTAVTLLRGYGVQVWSFWQDISQLSTLYPRDWRTIMNNCRVIQLFGRGMAGMSAELAQSLDVDPKILNSLAPEDLLAWVEDPQPQTLRRAVCYADEDLRDLCDEGPFAKPTSKKQSSADITSDQSEEDRTDDEDQQQLEALTIILNEGGDQDAGEIDLF